MARLDWERATTRERGWRAGADPDRPEFARSLGCDHKWGPWSKTQFDSRWHRYCAKCPKAQVRSTAPGPQSSGSSRPSTRVARTKGDLLVRHVDGTSELVAAKDATRAAREAIAASEERERDRETQPTKGSPRKTYAKQPKEQPFKKQSGEAQIDRVFRSVEEAQAATPVRPAAASVKRMPPASQRRTSASSKTAASSSTSRNMT